MTTTADVDALLEVWLGDDEVGPAPRDVVAAAFAMARQRRQRRWARPPGWVVPRPIVSRRMYLLLAILLAVALGTVAVVGSQPSPMPLPTSGFIATGEPVLATTGHTATRLFDGRVLLAGGYYHNEPVASAQIYDPASGSFLSTGSMATPRAGHSAILLDDGRVLIAGGSRHDPRDLETYDPTAGAFTISGTLTSEPVGLWRLVSVVRLADGRLIAFGPDQGSSDTGMYVIDPHDLTATSLGDVRGCAGGRGIAPLPGGRAMVACHDVLDRTDAAYALDLATAIPTRLDVRVGDGVSIAQLADGRLLLHADLETGFVVYDPANDQSAVTGLLPFGSPIGSPGFDSATQLLDSRVLLTSGVEAALWDPDTNTFTMLPSKQAADGASATLLDDGRVLLVGGSGAPGAELFIPGA